MSCSSGGGEGTDRSTHQGLEELGWTGLNISALGTSLVVQWLGLHAPTSEGLDLSPCWGTKIL